MLPWDTTLAHLICSVAQGYYISHVYDASLTSHTASLNIACLMALITKREEQTYVLLYVISNS